MSRDELREKLFEAVLEAAVQEDFLRELDSLPGQKDLEEIFQPSERLRAKILAMIKVEEHRKSRRNLAKAAGKAAGVAAAVAVISLGSLMSVEASRNAIFNAVLDWKSDHVDIYFQRKGDENASRGSNAPVYKPEYIPEGFIETKTQELKANMSIIIYQDKNGNSIVFEESPSAIGNSMVDTEHTIYKEITIKGQKATLFEAKTSSDKSIIFWQTNKINFMIYSTIDSKELIRMAESTDTIKK